MKTVKFPETFLFGVATSAAQIEGAAFEEGRGMSIWDTFARIPGMIGDGSVPDNTCDFYHLFREDIKRMKDMNLDTFRFSFSWSRIFPEGIGKINQKGVDFYKRLLEELQKNDMIPNATLYHWDLPWELERKGGWLNRECVDWYGEYASFMFREFGDQIPLWVTFNEPIATYVGYGMGGFAPGRIGENYGRQANHHVLLAHGEGVQRFRQENLKDAQVGIVVDMWHHHPLRPDSVVDQRAAELENEKAYGSYLNPIFKGEYHPVLLEYMKKENCMPIMKEGDMERICVPLDFYGLNCYNRVVTCGEPHLMEQIRKNRNLGGNFMDNGNEFYPKAVYDAIHILKEKYKVEIPIYITENGTYNCGEEIQADGKIHDDQRIEYMKGFLYWIHKAMEEGADIRGYYAWSLLDNWEWSAGFDYRFGLIHVDYDTQERIWKDSGIWYSQTVKSHEFEITDDFAEE